MVDARRLLAAARIFRRLRVLRDTVGLLRTVRMGPLRLWRIYRLLRIIDDRRNPH